MHEEIAGLEPKGIWKHFVNLNAVPRPSKKEDRVRAFIRGFGQSLGLETNEDEVGNIIIRKPASPGMEGRPGVILQSHLDMVHQKNSDTDFDFDTQGIRMVTDGLTVRAVGTTLGADNGLGVAAIMEILEASDIAHPPLEALFTIDEETGMTGALGLRGGMLKGRVLLNLDTEDDRELTIGCAGGVDVTTRLWYSPEPVPTDWVVMRLQVSGLTGGHSGMDIHLGRANANKVMNRLFYRMEENFRVRIVDISGGGLRNAIPRESAATLVLPPDRMSEFENHIRKVTEEIREENRTTDPSLRISISQISGVASEMLPDIFQTQLIAAVYACPNGIYRMNPDILGLVRTSNNLARMTISGGRCEVMCLARSSSETEKEELARTIGSAFEAMESETETSGAYPGWDPKPDSPIVSTMTGIYQRLFNEKPMVSACHAGLECGILGRNYPGMDMVSFGPNIRGAHSPDEAVEVASVVKFRKFLLAVLSEF